MTVESVSESAWNPHDAVGVGVESVHPFQRDDFYGIVSSPGLTIKQISLKKTEIA